jgi:hypothetical protein
MSVISRPIILLLSSWEGEVALLFHWSPLIQRSRFANDHFQAEMTINGIRDKMNLLGVDQRATYLLDQEFEKMNRDRHQE